MFASIVKGFPFKRMLPALMVIALTLFPLLASADEDPCRETGIYILNQTQLGSWFKRNGGPCTIWHEHYLLNIKTEDTLIIYKDIGCKTEYYSENPTYDVYKSVDVNQNCKVRILLDRTLGDL